MKRNKWLCGTLPLSVLVALLISGLSFSADRDKDDTAKKKTTKIETVVKQKADVPTSKSETKGSTNTQSATSKSGGTATGVTSPIDVAGNSQPQTSSTKSSPVNGELILWYVIASGGGEGISTNYILNGTAGQFAVGSGTSTNYSLSSGFWQDFGCCILRGNVDGLGVIDISDLTYLVAFMFGGGPPPPCLEGGNIDGLGVIDISDLTYLVTFMFGGGTPPPAC